MDNKEVVKEAMDNFMQSLGMPDPDKTIGFFGKRVYPNVTYVQNTLRRAFLYFHKKGFRHVIVGGASSDTSAANEVIKLRNGGLENLVLTIVTPYPEFVSKWSEHRKFEFHKVWEAADYTFCLGSKGYASIKHRVCDEYVASSSSMIMAVWDGEEFGNIWDALEVVNKLKVPVFRVCPKLKRKGWLR